MYTPKIATHWNKEEAQLTYEAINREAEGLTEDEITRQCQACCAEANKWNKVMIHDPKLQDSRDRMYGRWVADNNEMAAIWARVEPGKK